MSELPDGSEKGLARAFGRFSATASCVGLAPPAGVIDRNTPYKRIATEEAWTFSRTGKAQVEYFERRGAGRR